MPRLAPDQREARDRRIRARLQSGDRPADIARDERCDPALVYEKRNKPLGRGSAFRKKVQRLINRMPPEERGRLQI